MAHDFSDDAQGGFQRRRRHRKKTQGIAGNNFCELAGEAIQHGAARLGVPSTHFLSLD